MISNHFFQSHLIYQLFILMLIGKTKDSVKVLTKIKSFFFFWLKTYLREHFKACQFVSLSTCRAEVSLRSVNHGLWKQQCTEEYKAGQDLWLGRACDTFKQNFIFIFIFSYYFKIFLLHTHYPCALSIYFFSIFCYFFSEL